MNTLSIIIVNYRAWRRLSQCLDALAGFSGDKLEKEVIIVDNFSDDGQLTLFADKYPKFRFILNSGNNGFSDGCNKGAEAAGGSYFLFLNPDTIASEESLIALLSFAEQFPEAIVSCGQINDKGEKGIPYGRFPALGRITGLLRFLNRIFSGKEYTEMQDKTLPYISVDWVSGSVVLLSKEQFSKLGGWDTGFWMYYEDVDLCRRLKNGEGKVLIHSHITIVHNHGGASRINPAIASLTKCEVHISRHFYISCHEKGLNGFLMHLVLIISNLIFGLIPVLVSLPFIFFFPKLKVQAIVYLKLMKYYLSAVFRGSWISPRSVKSCKSTT